MEKILIIIPRLDTSGPVRGAIAASNTLAAKDNKVTLFCIYHNSIDISSLGLNENIDLIVNNNTNIIKKIYDLKHLKKSNHYSLVISYCLISDLFSLITKTRKNEYIYIRGNLLLNYFYDDGFFGVLKFLLHFFIIIFSKNILVLNESYKNLLRLFFIRAYVIPNIIDEKKYIQRRKKNNNYKFLFVGSISYRKNIINLIKDFAKYSRINKFATLTIYGKGPLEDILISYIQSNRLEKKIFFKGSTNNIFNIYKDYDYFLLPSFSEGTSRASLEALFCGLPILLFDIDSNKDLITKSSGILINKETPILDGLKKLTKINPSNSSLLNNKFRVENFNNNISNIIDEEKNKTEKKNNFIKNTFSLEKYSLYSSTIFNYISKISSSFLFLFILYLSASNYSPGEITLWFIITALSGMFYFADLGISSLIFNSKLHPNIAKSGINFYLNLTFIYIFLSLFILYFFINEKFTTNITILENKVLIIISMILFFVNNFLIMFEKFNISKLNSKNHHATSVFISLLLLFSYLILHNFNLTNFFVSVIFCFLCIFFTNLFYLVKFIKRKIISFYLISLKDYKLIFNILRKSFGYFLTQMIYVFILGSDLLLCSLFSDSEDKYNFFLIHKLLQILILPLIFMNILSWSHLANLKNIKQNLFFTKKRLLIINIFYFIFCSMVIFLFINPILSFFDINNYNFPNSILFIMLLRSFVEVGFTFLVSLIGYRSYFNFKPSSLIIFLTSIIAIKYIFYDSIFLNILFTSLFVIMIFIINLKKNIYLIK